MKPHNLKFYKITDDRFRCDIWKDEEYIGSGYGDTLPEAEIDALRIFTPPKESRLVEEKIIHLTT